MIDAAATVEPDRSDALLDGALANELAHERGGLLVGAHLAGRAELGVEGGGGAQGLALGVIDDLRVDVGVGAVYAEAGTLWGTEDLGADAALAARETRRLLLLLVHSFSLVTPPPDGVMVLCLVLCYLAALPSLRRMRSPS